MLKIDSPEEETQSTAILRTPYSRALQYAVYNVHCAVCSLHFAVCTMHSLPFTMHSAQRTLHSAQ